MGPNYELPKNGHKSHLINGLSTLPKNGHKSHLIKGLSTLNLRMGQKEISCPRIGPSTSVLGFSLSSNHPRRV